MGKKKKELADYCDELCELEAYIEYIQEKVQQSKDEPTYQKYVFELGALRKKESSLKKKIFVR